jgi:hypothetical protein
MNDCRALQNVNRTRLIGQLQSHEFITCHCERSAAI